MALFSGNTETLNFTAEIPVDKLESETELKVSSNSLGTRGAAAPQRPRARLAIKPFLLVTR